MTQHSRNFETRVLILPATRKDGEVSENLLRTAGIGCAVCVDAAHLATEITRGAGTLLVTEKLAMSTGFKDVLAALDKQEAWSDLPIVLLSHDTTPASSVDRLLSPLRNVTVLERPASMSTVRSAVQAALRARNRQYEIAQLLKSEQAARFEGEQANRMKDEFLATLSHELRTPLNSIFGWVQILKLNPTDKDRVKEAADVIDRNVRVQTQLIEDLLDMSRIISGKIRLDVQSVELTEVIQAALEGIAPAIDAKGIRLEKVVDPLLGAVSGDFNRLQQVLWNLLSNAVKFTQKFGRIHVLAERVNSHVEVSVTDTGEGIDPQFLPFIFDRFSQADGSTTRRHSGLGLGLSIVKNLVELHGGTVQAESRGQGQGSTFVVRLPIRISKRHDDAGSHPLGNPGSASLINMKFDKLRGVKVLVIDDEPDARELVSRFLQANDAIPVSVASAIEAEELIHDFQPDVIVSDIGMPGEDGYEFIRKIRASGNKTPAIALTAFARAEDRIRSIEAGYQTHLQKPVEPAELFAMIIRLHEC